MIINLNTSAMTEVSRSGGSAETATAKVKPEAVDKQAVGVTEDVAELSGATQAVPALKAQLDRLPDVRQERVQSLQQAIANGSFTISPQRIAEAMLAGPQASSR